MVNQFKKNLTVLPTLVETDSYFIQYLKLVAWFFL